MNLKYPMGTQEWYLQQRRKDKEDSGEIKVVIEDKDEALENMEVRVPTDHVPTARPAKNVSRGACSGKVRHANRVHRAGAVVQMSPKKVVLELWAVMSNGGNLAAGFASALHVNIYLLALGLLLSSPYMGIMTIVRLS